MSNGVIQMLKKKNSIPISIKFLFENFNLICFQYLIVIYSIQIRTKKDLLVQESLYYLILSLMEPYNNSDNILENKNQFQYLYYKIEKDLGNIIMSLCNLNLISISNEKESDKLNLKINITEKGKKIIAKQNNSSFIELQSKSTLIKKEMPYKVTLFKILKGEINEFKN